MPSPSPELRLRVIPAIADCDATAWDACANPAEALKVIPEEANRIACDSLEIPYNPFISHAFLNACEISGSATARTGWQPQHVLAETAEGKILGAVPCYLKSHSRGEYVFDRGWAEAYEHAGGSYYPKLQVAVPFTPATGRRFMMAPEVDVDLIQSALARGLIELARLRDASSAHITFMTAAEWRALGEHGFLLRTDQQFHWENAGFATFDDFLAALSSRKRKTIRRERRDALAADIEVVWLSGSDLTEAALDAFFAFYME